MSIEQLVEFFNNRFVAEYHSNFRPFKLEGGSVSGSFGSVKITSQFQPIRGVQNTQTILGHKAKIEVSNFGIQPFYDGEIERLVAPTGLGSIIHIDRLFRTVHILNYLKFMPEYNTLFLEVNPLHILEVKKDHGVYFEEILTKCGFSTKNIVIVLPLYKQYSSIYQLFIEGLKNYRRQGYKIALKVDRLSNEDSIIEVIKNLMPDFVTISAIHFGFEPETSLTERLTAINNVIVSASGQTILEHIDKSNLTSLAKSANIDLVEGNYYN